MTRRRYIHGLSKRDPQQVYQNNLDRKLEEDIQELEALAQEFLDELQRADGMATVRLCTEIVNRTLNRFFPKVGAIRMTGNLTSYPHAGRYASELSRVAVALGDRRMGPQSSYTESLTHIMARLGKLVNDGKHLPAEQKAKMAGGFLKR